MIGAGSFSRVYKARDTLIFMLVVLIQVLMTSFSRLVNSNWLVHFSLSWVKHTLDSKWWKAMLVADEDWPDDELSHNDPLWPTITPLLSHSYPIFLQRVQILPSSQAKSIGQGPAEGGVQRVQCVLDASSIHGCCQRHSIDQTRSNKRTCKLERPVENYKNCGDISDTWRNWKRTHALFAAF